MNKRQRWAAVRARGLSGAKLAKQIGKSKHTVCRCLNGTQVAPDTATAIAAEIGMDAAAMWGAKALAKAA